MMRSEPELSKYVVEFFLTGKNEAAPKDSIRLKADNDSDAIAQANWLARHTSCHHFQVRNLAQDVQSVIFRAAAVARAV
jgi:hypothetical protein